MTFVDLAVFSSSELGSVVVERITIRVDFAPKIRTKNALIREEVDPKNLMRAPV